MEERMNGHKPGMMTRMRAWLLGVEPEMLAWTWNVTIDENCNNLSGMSQKG